MDLNSLMWLFVELIGLVCLFGLALFIVSQLPATWEPYKGWARIAVIIFSALLLMFWIVSVLTGGGHTVLLRR